LPSLLIVGEGSFHIRGLSSIFITSSNSVYDIKHDKIKTREERRASCS
jgi:hypothetical protein